MLRFESVRDQGSEYGSPAEYFAGTTGGYVRNARLCHTLASVHSGFGGHYDSSGYPWVTFVLGSGCLEVREVSDSGDVELLPNAVERLLEHHKELAVDMSKPSALAGKFVRSLIDDRLGPSGPVESSAGSEPQIELWQAELALAAALLTRFYHAARAGDVTALRRADDRAVLSPLHREVTVIEADLVGPANDLLVGLLSVPECVRRDRLREILERVQASIASTPDRYLKLTDLQLITELAWFYLTDNLAVYPDWSDLLLDISLGANTGQVRAGRPRPQLRRVHDATETVADRFAAVTRASFNSLSASRARSQRDRLYSSVARVLRQQAVLRKSASISSLPPPASAFVTSFDLELEMALWSDGDPFVVAVPVNLLHASRDDHNVATTFASSIWLGCVMRPDSRGRDLDKLMAPDEWFVLSGITYDDYPFGDDDDSPKLSDYPIVVRLSGCPLLALPSVRNDDGTLTSLGSDVLSHLHLLGRVQPDDVELAPALLLDEHSAMRQTAAEFYAWDRASARLGLPPEITGGASTTFARFWMVLGVQIGDSGVRYRLTSQMMSPTLFEKDDSTQHRHAPKRSGVVVNRRIDGGDRDLLYWYGFDVVTGRAEALIDEIDHHAAHLHQVDVGRRRGTADKKCDVK